MLILLLMALGLAGSDALARAVTLQAGPGATTPRSSAALAKEARAAYDRGDKAAFLSFYEELARRRPGEVFTLYNLACAQALNGKSEEAVRTLEEILARRVASNLDADGDFESIRKTEGYKRVVERMNSLRSLAVSGDGETLYFSDYRGLFAVDIENRRVTPIRVPPDLSLNGIDGLALFDQSLIAIQNGIVPHRVIRLDLARDGLTISRARILEMNHPDFDEPTLGVVADGVLYFSADSQGGKFLNEKHPIDPADMREAVILKLPLSSPGPRR